MKLALIMQDQSRIPDLAGSVEVPHGWPFTEVHHFATNAAPVTTDSGMQLQLTTTIDRPEAAKVLQQAIEYGHQLPFHSGSPHEAADAITRRSLAVLLAARSSATPGGSIPRPLPNATEALR